MEQASSETTPPPQEESPDGQASDDSQSDGEPAIPDHWDKYETKTPVPDAVKRMAFENKMTQDQFTATLNTFGQYMQAQRMAEAEQLKQQGKDFITKEWGEKAEYNLNIARRALQTVDPEGELKQLLDTTGFGNHPTILKFFSNLGKDLQEGGYLRGELRQPAGAKKTPAQLLYPSMNRKD
jgi:hypothetical protein